MTGGSFTAELWRWDARRTETWTSSPSRRTSAAIEDAADSPVRGRVWLGEQARAGETVWHVGVPGSESGVSCCR